MTRKNSTAKPVGPQASANGDRVAEGAPDPFDPVSLRLPAEMVTGLSAKKVLLTIPVRKPHKEWFIRVHADPDMRVLTGILETDEGREFYLIAPQLRDELAEEPTFSARTLCLAVTRQKVWFFWPLRMPGPDGRIDKWSKSALEVANLATKAWVQLRSNQSLGAYEPYQATAKIPDPEWPELPLKELLRIAFKDRLIDSLEHPVVRLLRGEV
jgi:hypothetical protein